MWDYVRYNHNHKSRVYVKMTLILFLFLFKLNIIKNNFNVESLEKFMFFFGF